MCIHEIQQQLLLVRPWPCLSPLHYVTHIKIFKSFKIVQKRLEGIYSTELNSSVNLLHRVLS